MAETGSVKVRIDDAMLRRRIRDELADAWDESRSAEYARAVLGEPAIPNPHRD